jgi:ribose transport system permease protein
MSRNLSLVDNTVIYMTARSLNSLLVRLHSLWPGHVVGEFLSKQWIDSVVPVTIMIVTLVIAEIAFPGYLGLANLDSFGRQFATFGLVALGMSIVVYCGGVDLSVGAVYAAANFVALYLVNVTKSPLPVAVVVVVLLGAMLGAINGFFIGVLKIRAFLVTLATLMIFRAGVELVVLRYGQTVATSYSDSDAWAYLGDGAAFGVPVGVVLIAVISIVFHLLMTRSRIGWRLQAVGGSRRSAHHAGINVRAMVFSAYVACSVLTAIAGMFYAARQGSVGFDTGVGLEIAVLTAVVLGGVSLGGGRGSVVRALAGAMITLVVVNLLLRLGVAGGITSTLLGAILLVAIAFDVKWAKNRHKILQKLYIAPTYFSINVPASIRAEDGSPYAMNDKLRDVEVLGLGQVDGPEDVILDEMDRLYTGTREGQIIRLSGPDFSVREILADIGGRPLGLAFDAAGNLVVCVGGMGVYGVRPDGDIYKVTDHTNRTPFSVKDDSIVRLADDLDIGTDGKIYFSDASTRYDAHTWLLDGFEARPNGRIICYDPADGRTRTLLRNLRFANGICVEHHARSLLFAESYACTVSRLWLDGPQKGQTEVVLPNLPGHPDNINRASDGNYWLAVTGMRSSVWDLSMTMPAFRLRMLKQIAGDEWLCPNVNMGCVLKFSPDGRILDCMWDEKAVNNPIITSMREHKGWLYLGGLTNNRISRIRLPDADPEWTGIRSYWKDARRVSDFVPATRPRAA